MNAPWEPIEPPPASDAPTDWTVSLADMRASLAAGKKWHDGLKATPKKQAPEPPKHMFN